MNINEAVEKIMDLETKCFYPDWETYKTAIANILQELLDTGGVGKEYMEMKK